MHSQLQRCTDIRPLNGVFALALMILLSSCASSTSYQPADIEVRDILRSDDSAVSESDLPPSEPGDESTPLTDRQVNIARAEYYQQLAESGKRDNQANAMLSAAEYFIQANDYRQAQEVINGLNKTRLDAIELDRYDIVSAYIAYAQADYVAALEQLARVLEPEDETQLATQQLATQQLTTQQIDALLLSSFCYQNLGDYNAAIAVLIRREGGLVGAARSETARYTWQVINSLSTERRQMLIESTENILVRNRLEQSLQGEFGQQYQEPQQFTQWRNENPSTEKQTLEGSWHAGSPRSIAVLLPLTSKFQKASQALMDGIKFQHAENLSPNKPQLNFYDIGGYPYQVPQFYAAAVQGGADLVIGPLGREYANQINSYDGPKVPTILLGGDTLLGGPVTRLTMSPELEGLRIAERAAQDGHLTAALLVPDTQNSRRTVNAFSRYWLQAGGKISKTIVYSPQQFDHSVELKQLFDINRSEYRYRELSRTLEFKPKFSAYQRADIDFIFMIADNDTGRIVRPQINFFSGSRIPVYATSEIFNGIQDPINNMDLEQTRFPIMPWVLRSAAVAPYAGQLNMLYALGSDAYKVAGNFQELRNNSNLALNGNTGQLSFDLNGEVIYQPVWASFSNGEAVATQTLGIDVTPLDDPEQEGLPGAKRLNQKGVYNDSNWDSRKSRRKTGS